MIIKISRGKNFAELTRYLIENRDHAVVDHREVSGVECAAAEMARVAESSERAKTVVFHASVAVAVEDGVRSDDFWKTVAKEMDLELGFVGHQRIIVRHRDKDYDHIHIFWCAVHPDTGMTPAKRWYRKTGATSLPGIGPCALTDEQLDQIPEDQRVRKSYDSFALIRMQHLSRRLEAEHGLRKLRSNDQRGAAREQGEERSRRRTQERRAERAGSLPLFERAPALRRALDLADWDVRSEALGRIGVGMKLVVRTGKNGPRIRGLVLFDISDPGNTLSASDLDLPNWHYGLRQIETRQPSHALTIEYWWPQSDLAQPHIAKSASRLPTPEDSADTDPHAAFRAYRRREKERGRRLEAESRSIRARQAGELQRLREALREERARHFANVEAGEHTRFRRWYEREVLNPAVARMRRIHRTAIAILRAGRLMTFAQFVDNRYAADFKMFGRNNEPAAAVSPTTPASITRPVRRPLSSISKETVSPEDDVPSHGFDPTNRKGQGR